MQAITLAQTPPRAIALHGFALLFGDYKRGALLIGIVVASMRFERYERMAHAQAVGKSAVELRARKAPVTGKHRKPI